VEVLDEELNFNKRLISEIHIKKQKQGLNLKKDTDLLHPIYSDLLMIITDISFHSFDIGFVEFECKRG